MLKELFEFTTTCDHLDLLASNDKHMTKSRSVANSQSEAIAIIAIGNPLIEEDSAATSLIQLIRDMHGSDRYCLFNFDGNFAWLSKIMLEHDRVIFLDSIQESTDGFVMMPLTRSVLENSGYLIRATHGLSWLDEVKMISDGIGAVFFVGIDGYRFKDCSDEARVALLERVLSELIRVFEKGNACFGGEEIDA